MRKITTLLTLALTAVFAAPSEENPLLKGILIVENSSKIQEGRDLEGVQFDGALPSQELVERLTPFLLKLPLTANGAEPLCSAIASYYQEKGDLRMSVRAPEQDTSQGVVQLVLEPEKLGKIHVKNVAPSEEEFLKKQIRATENGPINEKLIAQDLGWLNANPYRTVKVSYQDTDRPGVVDMDLQVTEKKNWKVSTGVQNNGNDPIGINRAFAKLDVNHFIFQDHTLKFKTTTVQHFKDFQSYSLDYTAPLPWRNTLYLSGSYASTTPNREPYPHRQRENYTATLRYAIPQWFSKGAWLDQLTYEVGGEFKGTNTNLFFQDDPAPVEKKLSFISQLVTSLKASGKWASTQAKATLSLIGSLGEILPHQTAADFDNLRQGATPQYFYSKLQMNLDQNLFQSWKVALQARAQFALSNLVPSEQFSLGGEKTIRGYDEKVVKGDHALCANLELKSPGIPLAGWIASGVNDQLQLLGFIDAGYGIYREKVAELPLYQSLLGVGPGVRYSIGSYFSGKVDVGFPLLQVEKSSQTPHVHFSAVLSY